MPATTTVRMTLIDQLSLNAAKLTANESPVSKSWSIEQGDIPGVFRRMYDIANSLASKEALIWLHTRYSQEEINWLRRKEARGKENEAPSEKELLDFVDAKREEYMKRMTSTLELFIKSRWSVKEETKKVAGVF